MRAEGVGRWSRALASATGVALAASLLLAVPPSTAAPASGTEDVAVEPAPPDPGLPTDPTAPTDPGLPTDPTAPTDPGTPSDPGVPTDPGTPAPTPTPTPRPPDPLPTEIGSWCLALYPPKTWAKEKRWARDLMAGRVDLGKGGTYTLTTHPNWKPQRTADTSGNRHVHSLDWALPLLYVGVRTQNRAMIDRFTQLIRFWIKDHAKSSDRSYWIKASIFGGKRTQTLLCAAQTLGDKAMRKAAIRDARSMLSTYHGGQSVGYGVNNTDLIRQTGAFAVGCWRNDGWMRNTGWRNLVAVARGVVQDDGSDVEGSPAYAVYDEQLLREIERAAAQCGTSPAPIPTLRNRLYDFIAQAVRPDFRLESLGDGIAQPLPNSFGVGLPEADWVRTAGAIGTAPGRLYSVFSGGYVFGRATWQLPERVAEAADSFYSLRFTSSRPRTAHSHDDGGGLTFFALGREWIGDPGPYRYNTSRLRAFLKTRTAHSSLTVAGVRRTWSSVRLVDRGAGGQDGRDVACVRDRSWSTVVWVRCVRYDRAVDALVVTDSLTAKDITPKPPKPKPCKPKKPPKPGAKPPKCPKPPKPKPPPPRIVTQRWQVTPGTGVAVSGAQVTLVGDGQQVTVVGSGPGPWSTRRGRSGSSEGWHTTSWGHKAPGTVLARSYRFPTAGGRMTWTTVLTPQRPGDPASVALDPTVGNGPVTITRGPVTSTF